VKEKKKIGELLREAGLIDDLQLNSSLAYQREWGGKLGSILLKKGFVSETEIASIISGQYHMPCVSLAEIERPSDEILKLVKADIAKRFEIFPLGLEGKSLLMAVADPTDLKTLDDISFTLGIRIKPVLALESEISRAIETNYDGKFIQGKFIIEQAKVPSRMVQAAASGAESLIVEEKKEREEVSERREPEYARPRSEISQKAVIESVIDLLVAKGVFTKDELMRQIRSKTQQ